MTKMRRKTAQKKWRHNWDKYKNEARLIGVDYASNISEIPNTLADVADYIVANGIYGFLEIYADSSNDIVLTTSGLEIDFCPDREYLNALLPVLSQKLREAEQAEFTESVAAADNAEELDNEEEMEV